VKLARLTATLMAVVALGACSDDPEPKVGPPSDSASSASMDTSPTAEPTPTLGPEETVRAWVKARNTTVLTGNIADVRDLSSRECQSCVDSYGPVHEVYLEGGHYETDGWRISASEVRKLANSMAQVSVGIVYAAGRTVPSEGASPVTYNPERHVMQFDLVVEEGAWKVDSIVYLS
jgi:hypothetical protein